MIRRIFLIPTMLASSCTTVEWAGPVTGQWGGTHIGINLTSTGGTIEYDCAAGSLTGPIIPGSDGRFQVQGTHTPGHGGPAVEGEILPVYPVRFTGNIRGNRMTITGRVANGVLLGPFTLRHGEEPGIFRCL